MKTEDRKQLQIEREKLDRLVDEALKNGTPISETYEIMKQCEKVDRLLMRFYNDPDNDAYFQKSQ